MRKLYVWGMPAGTPRGPDSHVSGLARCRWEFGAEPRERPKAPVAYGLVSYVNSIRVLRKKRGRVGCKRAYFLFQHGRDNGKRGATLCLNYRFIGLHRRPPFFLFIFPSIIKHRTFQSFYPSTIPLPNFFSLSSCDIPRRVWSSSPLSRKDGDTPCKQTGGFWFFAAPPPYLTSQSGCCAIFAVFLIFSWPPSQRSVCLSVSLSLQNFLSKHSLFRFFFFHLSTLSPVSRFSVVRAGFRIYSRSEHSNRT